MKVFLDVGSSCGANEGTCSAPHEGLDHLSNCWTTMTRAQNMPLI